MATLSEATAQLAAWEAASLALASGKTAEVNGRRLDRSNASEVLKMIAHWESKIRVLTDAASGFDGRFNLVRFPR